MYHLANLTVQTLIFNTRQNMNLPIRQSVKVLLINAQKELLLMQADDPTTRSKESLYSGPFWFLVGGQIEKEESFEQAAVREIHEETGLSQNHIELGPIVWHYEYDLILNGTLTHLDQTFIVVKTNKKKVELKNPTEWEQKAIQKLRWFTFEEILNCNEKIYPTVMPKYLPDILSENYPSKCIEINK